MVIHTFSATYIDATETKELQRSYTANRRFWGDRLGWPMARLV